MTTQAPPSSERRMERDLMVTGEAVALEVVPATLALRLLSGAIDYGLYALGLFITLTTLFVLEDIGVLGANRVQLAVLVSAIMLSWLVVVPLGVELLSRGRSAGRLVMGTRVVRDDGGAVRWRHSLVRTLVGMVEIWIAMTVPALCSCIVTKRGKRLGDLLADTYVVRDRHGIRDGLPLIMPPELTAWAEGADLRRIPGHLSLATRTFLQRAGGMHPGHRQRMGLELAQLIEQYVAPPPPAGTHPERFLAAVMVERRNRELVLEMRDRALEDSVRTGTARPAPGPGRSASASG